MMKNATVVSFLFALCLPVQKALWASGEPLAVSSHLLKGFSRRGRRKLKNGKSSCKSQKSGKSSKSKSSMEDVCEDPMTEPEPDDLGEVADTLCPIFELYHAWHCKAEACPDSFGCFDPSSGSGVYGDLYTGCTDSSSPKGFFCMLKPFHDRICPSDATACSCDQNLEYKPEDGLDGCRTGSIRDPKTKLIEYCEQLTNLTYVVDDKKAKKDDNVCIVGCTRYIAVEGYGCCDVECDCPLAEIECPERTCAEHRVQCESD